MSNQPQCAIANFTTEECISSGIPIYNRYADVFLRPDVRKEVIQRANLPNFMMYIYDLRREFLGAGERLVDTRKYMWEEVNDNIQPYQFTIQKTNSAGSAGQPVTVTILNPVVDGYVSPLVGNMATTTINGIFTEVKVSDVNGTSIELTPINGMALDFTAKNYTFTFNPTITYEKSCSGQIETYGFGQSQPEIGVGVVQEYEKGTCICQDAISHYGYDEIPTKMQMFNPLNNQWVDTWCLPTMAMDKIAEEMFYGQFYAMMFGQYNYLTDTGIQGLLPTIQSRGGLNMPIKPQDPTSLFATLKYLAMFYSKKGIRSFTLWCDRNMYMNINEAIAKYIGKNNFGLPVWQGSQEHINWYNFKSLSQVFGIDCDIRINTITGWEQMQYDNLFKNFAILIPDTPYITSTGAKVPMIEIVKIKGCDGYQIGTKNGAGTSIWYDDTRQRGKRQFNVYARNQFGMDIHGTKFMGLLTDKSC